MPPESQPQPQQPRILFPKAHLFVALAAGALCVAGGTAALFFSRSPDVSPAAQAPEPPAYDSRSLTAEEKLKLISEHPAPPGLSAEEKEAAYEHSGATAPEGLTSQEKQRMAEEAQN
ncbi:MAG TPA: hypothetical protein VHD55_00175 [Candidatus Paceibacterota bacterium]|nr:hypothetical protein [Candidatus Paceibacterota bacterium]